MKKLLIKNIAEFEAVKAYVKNNKELMEKICLGALNCDLGISFTSGKTIYLCLDGAGGIYHILWDYPKIINTGYYEFKDFVEFFDQIPKKSLTFHDLDIGDVFVWPEYRKRVKRIKVSDNGFWIIDHNEEIVKGNPYFEGIKKDTEMRVELIKTFKD